MMTLVYEHYRQVNIRQVNINDVHSSACRTYTYHVHSCSVSSVAIHTELKKCVKQTCTEHES